MNFIRERFELPHDAFVTSQALFEAYMVWAKDNQAQELSKIKITQETVYMASRYVTGMIRVIVEHEFRL
jgi:hypothetical protein